VQPEKCSNHIADVLKHTDVKYFFLFFFLFYFFTASLGVISNPLGALMSGVFMQTLGRKTTVQLTSIPFLIGWTIIGLSTDITFLCLGRFISGMAIGKQKLL